MCVLVLSICCALTLSEIVSCDLHRELGILFCCPILPWEYHVNGNRRGLIIIRRVLPSNSLLHYLLPDRRDNDTVNR